MTCAFIYQFGSGTYVVGPKLSPLEATEEATNLPPFIPFTPQNNVRVVVRRWPVSSC